MIQLVTDVVFENMDDEEYFLHMSTILDKLRSHLMLGRRIHLCER